MNAPNTPDFLKPLPRTVREVKLPSNGVVYDEGPAKSGKISLAAMTLVEESLIYTPDGIDVVLKRCVQDPINTDYLLAADKFFLFLMLRAVTYGPEYSFSWTCTAPERDRKGNVNKCGHRNRATVYIPDDFKIKRLTQEDKEPFKVHLPESGKTIKFRLQRSYDEKLLDAFMDSIEKDKQENIRQHRSAEAFQLAQLLVEVDGNKISEDIPQEVKMRFISSLPGKDNAAYRHALDFYTPGLDTEVSLTCEKCKSPMKRDLPLTYEFFRPGPSEPPGPTGNEVRPDEVHGDVVSDNRESSPPRSSVLLRETEGDGEGGNGMGKTEDGNSYKSSRSSAAKEGLRRVAIRES